MLARLGCPNTRVRRGMSGQAARWFENRLPWAARRPALPRAMKLSRRAGAPALARSERRARARRLGRNRYRRAARPAGGRRRGRAAVPGEKRQTARGLGFGLQSIVCRHCWFPFGLHARNRPRADPHRAPASRFQLLIQCGNVSQLARCRFDAIFQPDSRELAPRRRRRYDDRP